MATTKVNSCAKGKRIERAGAKFLQEIGFPSARRGQQHKGGADSPDIVCDDLPNIHFEVKGDKRIGLGTCDLWKALDQSRHEAGTDQIPVVLWWESHKGWRLTFYVRVTSDYCDSMPRATLVMWTVTDLHIGVMLEWLNKHDSHGPGKAPTIT